MQEKVLKIGRARVPYNIVYNDIMKIIDSNDYTSVLVYDNQYWKIVKYFNNKKHFDPESVIKMFGEKWKSELLLFPDHYYYPTRWAMYKLIKK